LRPAHAILAAVGIARSQGVQKTVHNERIMHDHSATDLLRAGRENHRAGRLESAEALYRQAAQLDAKSVDARLNLGIVLHDLGRSVEAAEILGQLVVDDPKHSAAWVHLARTIVTEGFGWEAHKAIDKALRGKPDAQTLVAASMLLMSLHDDAAAESACRRALKLAPDSAAAWNQMGQLLAAKGQQVQAAEAYQRALASEPGNAIAGFFLAALHGTAAAPPAIAPPEYVRSLFDAFADQFDGLLVGSLRYRTPKTLHAMFTRFIQRSTAEPATSLTMLDAGCGTGLCGHWLSAYRGRLIGVDLSRGMLAKAKARDVYDELITGDVVEELEKRSGALDLVVAADVMVYFGDLSRLFAAAAAALHDGGVFLFSVESIADADYLLLPTQRFAHSMGYLQRLAGVNGLAVRATEKVVLRLDKGADVHGYAVLTEKA